MLLHSRERLSCEANLKRPVPSFKLLRMRTLASRRLSRPLESQRPGLLESSRVLETRSRVRDGPLKRPCRPCELLWLELQLKPRSLSQHWRVVWQGRGKSPLRHWPKSRKSSLSCRGFSGRGSPRRIKSQRHRSMIQGSKSFRIVSERPTPR